MTPIKYIAAIIRDASWTKLDERKTDASFDGFSRSLSVWLNKPHVANRRLSGTQILRSSLTDVRIDSLDFLGVINRFLEQTLGYSTEGEICDVSKLTNNHSGNLAVDVDNLDNLDSDLTAILLRDLLPKQVDRYLTLRELVIFDKKRQTIIFCPVSKHSCGDSEDNQGEITQENCVENEIPYRVTFHCNNSSEAAQNCISIEYSTISTERAEPPHLTKPQSHVTPDWLREVLFVKLCRWAEAENLRTGVTSLRLVPVDKYTVKYQQLKNKYGPQLVKIWPENTDPQKFVYEDIAIATYLLLLWEKERQTNERTDRQSFVDLGCGNGLLVYLLTMEGHTGLGIDVRKRKIWDLFGPTVNLKETSITPSSCSLFPEYDWLIGNHNDELTPWIPVIAARSSYSCSYFVLPCCLHDFDRKYSRKEPGRSQYRTYLDFVKDVGMVCGFEVQEDTLRIPSTKRVCFIGTTRTYSRCQEEMKDKERADYITERCLKKNNQKATRPCPKLSESENVMLSQEPETKRGRLEHPASCQKEIVTAREESVGSAAATAWAGEFEPRSSKEKSKNCRDVSRTTKEEIVQKVFDEIMKAPNPEVKVTADGREWRRGGSLPLASAAGLFDRTVLQELKSECGGIQTLLRNHHYIFQVTGGCVTLRDTSLPRPPRKSSKKRPTKDFRDLTKTFLCWFNDHHPDGCPNTPVQCLYAHGDNELREKT